MSCVFRGPIFLGLICALVSSVALRGEQKVSFELRDGDRVAFLGNSFFERARHHGYLETSLALRWPERRITFRNLGWDGDTVFGHSRTGGRRRSVFGDPEEGFGKMIAHLRQLDPTVIFIAYGWNESFAGLQGIAPFRAGLTRLLQNAGAPTRRFVLLTPVPLEQGFGTELSSPRRIFVCPPDAPRSVQDETFEGNLAHIKNANFLVVNTRDKDIGTIWEAGYAHALNIPIVYFCAGLPEGAKFNLMLARSGIKVCTSFEQLEDYLDRTIETGSLPHEPYDQEIE